jgi:hypothetical protein
MKEEQHTRAVQIVNRLADLKNEEEIWTKARSFPAAWKGAFGSGQNAAGDFFVELFTGDGRSNNIVEMPTVDFDVLRAIRLQKIQSEIKTLTQEFEQL